MDPEPRQEPPSTPGTSGTTPSVEKTEIDGVSCLRNSFTNHNISGHVADILMASWRSSTQKQYKTYIEQWLKFCGEGKINYYSPQIGEALYFLAGLYDKHLSYSTLKLTLPDQLSRQFYSWIPVETLVHIHLQYDF